MDKLLNSYKYMENKLNGNTFTISEAIEYLQLENDNVSNNHLNAFKEAKENGFDTKRILHKVILIDADKQKINEVIYDGTLDTLYKYVDCKLVDRLYLENGDCCYIDDEGNFTNKDGFYIEDCFIKGNALIVGTCSKGYDIAPSLTIEELKEKVDFPKFIHEKWAKIFFEEKSLSLDTELNHEITIEECLKFFRYLPCEDQNAIKNKLVQIDFANGDILDFMNYIANGINQTRIF